MSTFIEATDEGGFQIMINLDRVRKFTLRECVDCNLCTVTYESGEQEDIDSPSYEWFVEFLDKKGLLYNRETGVYIVSATSKEKENIPPTPPIREKENEKNPCIPARAREDDAPTLICNGAEVPSIETVKKYAAAKNIEAEFAEEFWHTCNCTGWRYKGSAILNWQSLLWVWHRTRKRMEENTERMQKHIDAKMDERAEKRTAHIDKKMDEREKQREKQAGSSRRHTSNYVKATPEEVAQFAKEMEGEQ